MDRGGGDPKRLKYSWGGSTRDGGATKWCWWWYSGDETIPVAVVPVGDAKRDKFVKCGVVNSNDSISPRVLVGETFGKNDGELSSLELLLLERDSSNISLHSSWFFSG